MQPALRNQASDRFSVLTLPRILSVLTSKLILQSLSSFSFSKTQQRMRREDHAATSSISLEKEPAGALNKAQRLIEWRHHTCLSRSCKERSHCFGGTLEPVEWLRMSPSTWERVYRLTCLHGSGHVISIGLNRHDD